MALLLAELQLGGGGGGGVVNIVYNWSIIGYDIKTRQKHFIVEIVNTIIYYFVS